jgi:hypothetical protein
LLVKTSMMNLRRRDAVGPALAGDEYAVVLLRDRAHRGADRAVGAAGDGDDILARGQAFECCHAFLRHAGGVLDDELDLLAHYAAAGVELLDRHLHAVA